MNTSVTATHAVAAPGVVRNDRPADETGPRQIDETVARVKAATREFLGLTIKDRVQLADSMQQGCLAVADRMVRAACRAKGLDPATTLAAEDRASGPMSIVRHLRLVRETLEQIARHGAVQLPAIRTMADGRVAVRVFPLNSIDGLLFKDVQVETHMQAGLTEASVRERCGSFYARPPMEGRVVAVLGAGNIAAIPAMDVISKMFNEGKVCILKMNPVNAYLGPFIEEAFAQAITRGFLAVVYGGADVGEYLVHHDGVDEVHLTGSEKTHDAIVWGASGSERTAAMAAGTARLQKPVSAELGNISPVIVMPGEYTRKQLEFQAEDLAGALVFNAGFLCCAPVVVLTHKRWPQRQAFLDLVGRHLERTPPRHAYYPGAVERWRAATSGRPNVRRFGDARAGELPWAIIHDLEAGDAGQPIFRSEPFCPVMAEVPIEADNSIEFLARATLFANERLWGTLTANLIVPPSAVKQPDAAAAVEEALQELRYGVVTVNSSFSGTVFALASPPWGAFPGSTPGDIQSGAGWVHNTLMLEGIEKTIARFPITTFPKPVHFPSHRTADTVTRRLTLLEERASWARVPGVVLAAMRG